MAQKKTNKRSKKVSRIQRKHKVIFAVLFAVSLLAAAFILLRAERVHTDIDDFYAQPFNTVKPLARPAKVVKGITPSMIRSAYGLTKAKKGTGTIAIVNAFHNPYAEKDLNTFSKQFKIPGCTRKNKCFEQKNFGSKNNISPVWSVETALDTQWAHAIAPGAKILLVEARSNSGRDLLTALNFARSRKDVVAVSLSWGGDEFSTEANYENMFTSKYGATFFAASGDSGHGTSWPAVSANVVSVGGTSLKFDSKKRLKSETAWLGSGGGVSKFIPESVTTPQIVEDETANRAVPDVAFAADPSPGFPIYNSVSYSGAKGWFTVGGTSAGSPQWAALKSINKSITRLRLYDHAAATEKPLFFDVISGSNGSCALLCNAGPGYDYVTGLGAPRGVAF